MNCGDDIGMHGQASPFRAPVRMGGRKPRVAAERQPWAIEDNLFEVIPIQVQRRTTGASPVSPQARAVCDEGSRGVRKCQDSVFGLPRGRRVDWRLSCRAMR